MCYGACIKFRSIALLNISGRTPLGELLATGLTAHRNARIRSSLTKAGSLAETLLTAATTAALSQRQHTLEPDQWMLHKATPMTMGTSSLGAIVTPAQC